MHAWMCMGNGREEYSIGRGIGAVLAGVLMVIA